MVAIPGAATLPISPAGEVVNDDPIVITLPIDGYENVARLVAGGLASRLDFGFETVDDMQLAIELVLRSIPERGGSTSLTLMTDERSLVVAIAPIPGLTLEQPLRALDGGGMVLGSSLERLVDSVELRAEPDRAIVLSKLLPGHI
ncbi:MAG TPA: hypothetical protein VG265_14920 [Gaiellaceae bacterium]|nr:hypothetical protein [Gaiellaceae bacterium]